MVLSQFHQHGLIPDWPDFINEALKCGWNPRSLRTKIEVAVGDVYGPTHGPEYKVEVIRRFDIYMKTRE